MREFRHRMQHIEKAYDERVKQLEAQLQEQRSRNNSKNFSAVSTNW